MAYVKEQRQPLSSDEVMPLVVQDLVEILQTEYEPLQWIIPDYLPEGLTLLFSRPKVGKSMLSLALSLRMARRVSGGIDGEILYLTLDDVNKRRFQSRARSLLLGREVEMQRVWVATKAETLDSGIITQLSMWIQHHPETKLIVIDVYARIKPRKRDDDVYKSDYDALCQLQEFSVKHHLAIILVHHSRKQRDTEDWIDNVNGSTGLTAAVDTLWTLERRPRTNDLTLRVKGRDTMGELAIALTLDDLDAPWKLEDEDADGVETNATERKILEVIESHESVTPKAVTELTGMKHTTVLGTLRRMLHRGLVKQTTYGNYCLSSVDAEVSMAPDVGEEVEEVPSEPSYITEMYEIAKSTPQFGYPAPNRDCFVCKQRVWQWNPSTHQGQGGWECGVCVSAMEEVAI